MNHGPPLRQVHTGGGPTGRQGFVAEVCSRRPRADRDDAWPAAGSCLGVFTSGVHCACLGGLNGPVWYSTGTGLAFPTRPAATVPLCRAASVFSVVIASDDRPASITHTSS